MGSPTRLRESAHCFTKVRYPFKLELTFQGASRDIEMDRVPHLGLFGDELRDKFREDVARRGSDRGVLTHERARNVASAVIPKPRISLDVSARARGP